ncbi:glycosyltransferase [bacterium]|nr:glycosyltransferase [bacterium]
MNNHKKLRIAFVTNNYTPYSGGVVSSINAFATQLMARGNTVLIITLDFLGDKHEDPPYVVRVPSLFRCMYNKNHIAVPWLPDRAVLRILREFKPDVVHAQHPFLLCESAYSAARTLSVPIVFTYHSMYERYSHYIPFYQPLVKKIITKKVIQFCNKVDHIIAPSRMIHNYVRAQKVATSMNVLPSPLRNQFFKNQVDSSCPYDKKMKLLLVSRLVKEKNVELVLDVFSKLNNQKYSLTIVGYGPQEEVIRDYAYKKLKLDSGQVTFVIKPLRQELLEQYRCADLFLFPSTSDTQGLVLAESMAAGTPVVAIDGPGQRDIVKNGKNGFIVDSDAQMVKKIQEIYLNKDLLKQLQDGAYKTAAQYAPDVVTDKLEQLYYKLISSFAQR